MSLKKITFDIIITLYIEEKETMQKKKNNQKIN